MRAPPSGWKIRAQPESASLGRDRKVQTREGQIPPVGINSLERGNLLRFGWRPGERPSDPRERGRRTLAESAEDFPVRRRAAISGGKFRVAIRDGASLGGVVAPLLAVGRRTILVDEGEPVARNVNAMVAKN